MALSRIEVSNGNDELTFDGGMVTIGGRTGVDIVLRDVMIADRHCVITYENGFVLRDTGSVTGTWVNGQRAAPTAELVDDATIVIGTTKLQVSVGDDDGTPTLKLTSEPQSFWWKKAGKGVFDNDPDQLVYSETKFGRFPSLRLGNRVALIVGGVVLLAATFVSSIMEPLADPGPLVAPHALVTTVALDDPAVHVGIKKCVELAGEQGCNVCHTAGSGATESKCVQCHGLEGEMGAEGSWRHPYHNDGKIGPMPGASDPEQFCVICHTDHNEDGSFKPIAETLLGKCAKCHSDGSGNFNRDQLIATAEIKLPPAQPKGFEPLTFPHDKHLSKEIGCDVCHQRDANVVAARDSGVADDPYRRDFAPVAYAICATCHVEGAANALDNITAEQRTKWTPEKLWTVRWHGVGDQGKNCTQCHTSSDNNGTTVFGPEMKTVTRREYSTELYQEERARFTVAARSHSEQFLKHADGQACKKCHLDGKITQQPASKPARTFWHALHVTKGSLTPADPASAAEISMAADAGCVSCHKTLGQASANSLTPASSGPYKWPDDAESRAACAECHEEGKQALPLVPAPLQSQAKTRAMADFPHDTHVGSPSFGKDGTLAQGCFACHNFSEQTADAPFTQVPRTLPGVADCTKCHGGHDEIAGGDCQQCHLEDNGFNSFVTQTGQTKPGFPKRLWPAPNGFSHWSAGHKDETCAVCHKNSGLDKTSDLLSVQVPNEQEQLCRQCHLDKQFHWR